MRLRALRDRFRGSLFYLPSLYVAAAVILAGLVIRIDADALTDIGRSRFLLSVTVESGRALLSTIAGATITVAGIVFSVTVVAVQLASSEFSPRVLRNFLRDRLQQNVIGLMVGTFTYCTFVLATLKVSGPSDGASPEPNLPVTIAIVLAVSSILGIVAFIDHSARSMQVGHVIRRITSETRSRIVVLYAERPQRGEACQEAPDPPAGEPRVIRAWESGWIQQLAEDKLCRATAPGSYLRIDSGVGAFVVDDTPLVTIWGDDDVDVERITDAFVLGAERTMQQDVMFGIRQLVDIGLRALSTGVNDPTTAYEVIVHLGAILADILQCDLPPRVRVDDDGRTLVLSDRHDHESHVNRAFGQLRIAGAGQPAVLIRLLRTLHLLDTLMADLGLEERRAPLRRQARLVLATAAKADYVDEDLEEIHREAAALGLTDVGSGPPGAGHGD